LLDTYGPKKLCIGVINGPRDFPYIIDSLAFLLARLSSTAKSAQSIDELLADKVRIFVFQANKGIVAHPEQDQH